MEQTISPLTVPRAAKILGCSRITVYRAIERGEVPSFRLGRKILIPREAFEALVLRGERPEPGANR